jgi:hypothetical protein
MISYNVHRKHKKKNVLIKDYLLTSIDIIWLGNWPNLCEIDDQLEDCIYYIFCFFLRNNCNNINWSLKKNHHIAPDARPIKNERII